MGTGTSQRAQEPATAQGQIRATLLISAALALLLPACSRGPSSSSPCGDTCLAAGSTCGGCSSACGSGETCVGGQCLGTQVTTLSYQVNDAKYSVALDRIVIASYTDGALHLYDPRTNDDTSIPFPPDLPRAPAGTYIGLNVGLSPDGLRAVVVDERWVAYVDLVSATVLGQWTGSPDPDGLLFQGVAVGNDGYAYANYGNTIFSVSLSNGSFGLAASVGYDNFGRYPILTASPDGTTVYAMDQARGGDQWSGSLWSARPLGGQLVDVAQSTATTCGMPWVSRDGTRIFTGCGPTFMPAVATADAGAVPAGPVLQVPPAQPETSDGGDAPYQDPPIAWLDDPSSGSPVAAVGMDPNAPNQHTGAVALALYDPSTLALQRTLPVPLLTYGGVSHPSVPLVRVLRCERDDPIRVGLRKHWRGYRVGGCVVLSASIPVEAPARPLPLL